MNPLPSTADLEARFPHRHDRAFAYLRQLLLDGGLEPDQVISTETVGRALGISRAPVTDAIKRLVHDGFLTVIPQVGCRINAPQPREVGDFYRLFARSESVITGLAAQRRSADQAEALAAAVEDLDRQYRRLRAREAAGPELRALNRRRYEAIHGLAGSGIAAELVANMWDRSDFYIRVAYGAFVQGRPVHADNTAICRAIVAGDAETASARTEAYLERVGRQIEKKLAERLSDIGPG